MKNIFSKIEKRQPLSQQEIVKIRDLDYKMSVENPHTYGCDNAVNIMDTYIPSLIDILDEEYDNEGKPLKTMTVCLFDRHELPENLGPICSDFSFNIFRSVRNELWKRCIEFLSHGTVKLIVTGLTPALCEFLAEACANDAQGHSMYQSSFDTGYECEEPTGSLILLHYDSVKKDYWEQVIF